MANWFIESSRKLQLWNATLYVAVAAMHQKHVDAIGETNIKRYCLVDAAFGVCAYY